MSHLPQEMKYEIFKFLPLNKTAILNKKSSSKAIDEYNKLADERYQINQKINLIDYKHEFFEGSMINLNVLADLGFMSEEMFQQDLQKINRTLDNYGNLNIDSEPSAYDELEYDELMEKYHRICKDDSVQKQILNEQLNQLETEMNNRLYG